MPLEMGVTVELNLSLVRRSRTRSRPAGTRTRPLTLINLKRQSFNASEEKEDT